MSADIHPVDEVLPVPKLLTLGLQHVLVMYAGAVAVPLILGRALKLSPEEVAFLISADLFACGIAELAVSRGGHLHVGLESYSGARTPTNVELVNEAVALGRSYGREPVRTSHALAWLGLRKVTT